MSSTSRHQHLLHLARNQANHRKSPMAMTTLAVAAQLCFATAAFAQTNSATETEAAQELPEVSITAEATNASEVTKSYENPVISTATGLTLSRRQTPQSVSSVTRQQMDDEAVQTFDDALLHATGITATQLDVGGRTTYRARGYAITNVSVDGARLNNGNNSVTDFSGQGQALNMDLYDRVEILRGANGLMGSTGDPSGAISLIRKEARKTPVTTLSATLGNNSKKRVMADINRPFNSEGSVRGRFVFSGEDSDGFRDRETNKNIGVLANISADVTSSTKVNVGVQYERNKLNGATWGTNVPIWFADGSETSFSRSLSSSPSWSFSERENKTVFAGIEHEFDNQWRTKLQGAYTKGESTNHLAVAKANRGGSGGYWNQDGTGAYLNTMFSEGESTNKSLQWTLEGPFELAGRRHQLMFGVNGYDSKGTSFGLSCNMANGNSVPCMNRIDNRFAIGDWRDFIASGNAIDEVTATRTGVNTTTRRKNYGGYAASRFSITEPLSIIAGARISWQKNYSNGAVVSEFNHEITPYLGAVYDLSNNYSLYASYTDIFEVQTQRKSNGDYLDPRTGTAYELGLKGEWLDGLVDGSIAVFHTKQKKLATIDRNPDGTPRYVFDNEAEGTAYVNGASGVSTKGFEIDFSGQVNPNWNVYGGYTYLDVNDPNSDGSDSDPRNLLRLNTSYRLAGQLRQWTIGGGLTSQSKMRNVANTTSHPTRGADVNIDYKGYTLFHAMARYDINRNMVATFNVSNLFDKTYYRQYGFYSGAIYGQPRTYTLNLRASF